MTATTADPGTHLDTIEHLDWQPPCEAQECNADNPPATHIIHANCGCRNLACPDCTNRVRRFINAHLQFTRCTCKVCGTQYTNGCSHELYVSIKPL